MSERTKHSSIGDENMYSLLLGRFYLILGFSTYRKFREKWINDKIGNAVYFIAISLIVSSYGIVIILGAVPSSRKHSSCLVPLPQI